MKMIGPLKLLLLIGFFSSCNKEKEPENSIADTYGNDMVLLWNQAAATTAVKGGSATPMAESRVYAMINGAVHDALNNIVKRYGTYAFSEPEKKDASPDAAVSQAAHDMIVALLPLQKAYADSLLNACLSVIKEGNSKNRGIELGAKAASMMLASRLTDGAATAQYSVVQGTAPGVYRSTPPFDATGFVALPGWGKVKPFSLKEAAAFRPPAPYALTGASYAADLNEVKTMGCATCPKRTADQTQLGVFWLENVPSSWNRVARELIKQKALKGWETARLLALVHIAEADANIAAFDAKLFYNFWRPISAIRLADQDGNPETAADPTWINLAPPTPPAPDYPSNHAADGGAAAELLKQYFKKDDFRFTLTSPTLAGVTRTFTSLSQAASEVSLSRIYVGFHFRNAVEKGEEMGRKVGKYVFENALRPL
ncbi:MAG TPA: vanadium-dependent haloperoxidase [Flavisolibacter sp.]|jgi:hypothetical protein|nr:vanadium-dependent haloperoxidase [Flavisolibacter sp.]